MDLATLSPFHYNTSYFANLERVMTMALYDLFCNEANVQKYKQGDWIFVEGQPGDMMYVVKTGKVDIVYEDKVIETVGAGGIFGEMALIGSNIRSANAKARNDCELIAVDGQRFDDLIQQTPRVATEVMKVMADRLRRRTS